MIWPATPTPMPPGVMKFDIEGVYTLWNAAPVAIQTWNWMADGRFIIQLLLLTGLILVGGFVVYKSFNKLAEKDSQS